VNLLAGSPVKVYFLSDGIEPKMTPLRLAAIFHNALVRLAPTFDGMTQPEPPIFRPTSPYGKLMLAVCQEILDKHDVIVKPLTTRICQRCGHDRFHLLPSNNDGLCGTLEICVNCGQTQGQWGNQSRGGLPTGHGGPSPAGSCGASLSAFWDSSYSRCNSAICASTS
jgi:hypothetical protein